MANPKREADLSDGALLQIGKFKFQFNEGVTNAGFSLGRSAPVGEFDPAPGACSMSRAAKCPSRSRSVRS
jgi:hypothetical protein